MNARKIVTALLFAIAVLCCTANLVILIAHRNENADAGKESTSVQIQYEKVDLQAMLDELDANAMRAEDKFQGKYIEITGKINSFDSDGKYISVESCEAPMLNFDDVQCHLTDPSHKAFLLEKNVGDVVTIRGKVTSIGEIIGYHIDIIEISD